LEGFRDYDVEVTLPKPSINVTVQNNQTKAFEQMKVEGLYNPKLGQHTDFNVSNKTPDEVFNFISQGNGVQLPNGSWQYRSGPLRVDYYKGSTSGFESTIWLRYHGSGSFLKLRWP
jgi:hypothetical protein